MKYTSSHTDLIKAAMWYGSPGFSVLPTKKDKSPATNWENYKSRKMENGIIEKHFAGDDVFGVAIISGNISGLVEVIDMDCKHDRTGTLSDRYFELCKDIVPDVFD